MNKQKKEIIITIFLVVIFAFFLIKNIKPKRRKPLPRGKALTREIDGSGESERTGEKEDSGLLGRGNSADISEQGVKAQQAWGRDPFCQTGLEEVYDNTRLTLRGVSISNDKKAYAFINEQIVTVGDIIADYQVKEIQKNKVLLERGSENFYLGLPEE